MVWRLIAWMVFAVVQRRVALAGDADRERASASLREHYAGGYLTLDEFSRRTGRVLSARSRGQVQRALFGLSRPSAVDAARSAVGDMVLVVVRGAYVVFSLVLGARPRADGPAARRLDIGVPRDRRRLARSDVPVRASAAPERASLGMPAVA